MVGTDYCNDQMKSEHHYNNNTSVAIEQEKTYTTPNRRAEILFSGAVEDLKRVFRFSKSPKTRVLNRGPKTRVLNRGTTKLVIYLGQLE